MILVFMIFLDICCTGMHPIAELRFYGIIMDISKRRKVILVSNLANEVTFLTANLLGLEDIYLLRVYLIIHYYKKYDFYGKRRPVNLTSSVPFSSLTPRRILL